LRLNTYPEEIAYSPCPHCGVLMWLTRVEPQGTDQNKYTFECSPCRVTTKAVKAHSKP